MTYQDYLEPFFPVAPQELTLGELQDIAVSRISTWARQNIWEGFIALHDELSRLGLEVDIFVDGSFVTKKPNPNDIDCAVVVRQPPSDYSEEQRLAIEALVQGSDQWKWRHRCDLQFWVDHGDPAALNLFVDTALNTYITNAYGPPKRAVHLRVGA